MIPQLDKRNADDHHHHSHPGKPITRAQQMRKIKKPILEKKRRDRINKSLDDLKDLMMKVYNKDVSDHKLEKADILELTVQYLHMVNSGVVSGAGGHGGMGDLFYQYRTGYEHCLQEVTRYLQVHEQPGAHPQVEVHHRLLQHCQDKLQVCAPGGYTSPALPPELMSPQQQQPVFPGMDHATLLAAAATAAVTAQQQQLTAHLEQQQLQRQQQRVVSGQKQQQQQCKLLTSPAGCSSVRSSNSPAASDFSSGSEPMWRPW